MRDDGEVPVLDANSLDMLPVASGPWLPLPTAGLSLDDRDLAATAKRIVGIALAPRRCYQEESSSTHPTAHHGPWVRGAVRPECSREEWIDPLAGCICPGPAISGRSKASG